ncbi:MAG: DUF4386 domain-containing protein [Candidatus Thermoplasmatota archaeon]|nr:DUF4386 domain-containing protein [Candidatus Thermoplasmatota archaeon]
MVGALFITATVAGILSVVFLRPILDAPDYLIKVSANENQVIIGALFELIMAVACAGIAIWLYPVLKKHNQALALGSVSFRIIEAALYFVAVTGLLSLLTLSQEFVKAGAPDASHFQTLGTLLSAARDWAGQLGMIAFILGALMYYYIFYQSKLIPRWLSGWGLIGVPFWLAVSLLIMFGSLTESSVLATFLYLPIAVNEMVLAVWLIVKGFNPSAIASQSAKTDINKV